MSKERPDLRTREKIPTPTRSAARCIEAVLAVIERKLNDVAVGQWTVASDPLSDDYVKRGAQIGQAQPPTSKVTSATVSTNGGQMPKASVAKAVRPSAAWSENGTRIGMTFPSGASSAHIVRSTLR